MSNYNSAVAKGNTQTQYKGKVNFTMKAGVKDSLISDIRDAFKTRNELLFNRRIQELDSHMHRVLMSTIRDCVPIDERYLIVEHVDKERTNFSINPTTGKCVLRWGTKFKSSEKDTILKFVTEMMLLDLPPYGWRGMIGTMEDFLSHGYTCVLTSKSVEPITCKSKWMNLVLEVQRNA